MSEFTPVIAEYEVLSIMEEHPYIQTQALLIKCYELEKYINTAEEGFGPLKPELAGDLSDWFRNIEGCLDDIYAEIENDNKKFIFCRLSADDQEWDNLAECLNDYTSLEAFYNEELAGYLYCVDGDEDSSDGLLSDKINLVVCTVREVLYLLFGGGEPLNIVNRYKSAYEIED